MTKEFLIGDIKNFPVGSHKVIRIDNREIGVFNVDGKLYALPNLCPHQVGPLCEGRVSGTLVSNKDCDWKLKWQHEGEIITCPWHGLEFHIPSGQCMSFSIKIRTYEVVVENEEVKVRV